MSVTLKEVATAGTALNLTVMTDAALKDASKTNAASKKAVTMETTMTEAAPKEGVRMLAASKEIATTDTALKKSVMMVGATMEAA